MNFKCKNIGIFLKMSTNNIKINRNYHSLLGIFNEIDCFYKAISFKNFHGESQTDEVLKEIKFVEKLLPNEKSNKESVSRKLEIKNFLNSFRKPRYYFIVKKEIAESIVKKILFHIQENNCKLIEANPGFGFITASLIKSKISKIYILENIKDRTFLMCKLMENFPVVSFIDENLFTHEPSDQRRLFTNLFISITNSKIKHVILGVVGSNFFFTAVVYAILDCKQIDNLPFFEFYLVLNLIVFKKLFSYKTSTATFYSFCLLNLLFEIKKLEEYPNDAVFPSLKNKKNDNWYLVKLNGRNNVYDTISEENFSIFLHFLKIIGKSRFNLIIPTLEALFPGCGINLIISGITQMSRVCDLNYKDSVTLFNICSKLNTFSNFVALCNEDE